jgi:hypothetical protein
VRSADDVGLADFFYDTFWEDAMLGSLNLQAAFLKVMLVSSDYHPNRRHRVRADITGELVGEGYEPGGVFLSNQQIKVEDGVGVFDAEDVMWAPPIGFARPAGAIVYRGRITFSQAPDAQRLCWFMGLGGRGELCPDEPYILRFHEMGIVTFGHAGVAVGR